MKTPTFTRVADVSELAGAGPFSLSADGVDLAVVRADNEWRAYEGRCPHLGALLGEGELENNVLICRNHRWRFFIDSGKRDGGPECLSSCPIVERDGALFADVSGLRRADQKNAATRRLDELPGPKPLPFIGNLHQLDPASVHLILERWQAQFGPMYQFRMGPIRALAISDPSVIDQVLRQRPDIYRRQSKMDRVLIETGIHGVFNAEGEAWRPQRKLAVAALSQRNLRQLYPHIQMVIGRLDARWRKVTAEGKSLDIIEELKRFTVDVTMLIAFGHDANTIEQEDDVIQKHLKVVFPAITRRIFALIPWWRFIKLPGDIRFEKSTTEVRASLGRLLDAARMRSQTRADRLEPSTFLDAMVSAVDEHGRAFSDDVILSNLITMALAGEDTTALTLSWAIHFLCDHPIWASKIRVETDAMLGGICAPADLEAASKLIAASAVANETMRLRPVAPILLLEANCDTSAGGVEIPRGTTVAVLSRPAAVSDTNFVSPDEFRPERWLGEVDGPHNVGAHIPFGSGPRLCPGRSLALVEMTTLLAMLYKNFEVERVGLTEDVKEVFGFTMSPLGLKVRLRPRVQN